MFCYQCEQTAHGTGCEVLSSCGKDADTAALQDLLIHAVKGISMYAHRARKLGVVDRDVNVFTIEALFSTMTNVNFDPERLASLLAEASEVRDKAKSLYAEACGKAGREPESLSGPAAWIPAALPDAGGNGNTVSALIRQGVEVNIRKSIETHGDTLAGLGELLVYGLKGLAAYTDHAQILGREDDEVYGFVHESLDYLAGGEPGAEELLGLCLECGAKNLRAMELLDEAHTETYGHPEPTQVKVTPVKGKAIGVSGHDLKDLEEVLKQTEGKGINVYTHGELLPANAYPRLKAYKHLVGHFGTAWQNQTKEFVEFPGAILMTTNCLQEPKDSYKERIFTSGVVAWPGVEHVSRDDFGPVIESALAAPGFPEDGEDETITIGFARNSVLGVADKVIEAVKAGAIRHFFLIGGCDGAKSGRNYFTDIAQAVPDDCVILTLACGKNRFNRLEFGDIGGIPRLLDVGQCNDAYSAIRIAGALADAFETDVNGLPLSLVISWYEQKAVAILLTLLHLGIKNIRLGPTLPTFISPGALEVLVENFNIMPITTAEEDLKAILGEVPTA
jgi:hydroxylamine reductase